MTAGGGGAPAVTIRSGARKFHTLGGAILRQRADHDRRAAEMRDALGFDQADGLARLGLAHADVPAAGGGDCPGEAPAVAVEHRQGPQIHAALIQTVLGDFADRIGPGSAVGEHYALGEPCGAGSVIDGDAGVLIDDGRGGARRGVAEEGFVIVDHVGHAGIARGV